MGYKFRSERVVNGMVGKKDKRVGNGGGREAKKLKDGRDEKGE